MFFVCPRLESFSSKAIPNSLQFPRWNSNGSVDGTDGVEGEAKFRIQYQLRNIQLGTISGSKK